MAKQRAIPPEDIPPEEFFVHWVPARVAGDAMRREKLVETRAVVVFELIDSQQSFTVRIECGDVRGEKGASTEPDLRVELDVETWRALNRGELSAPEALLRRRLVAHGDLFLALKLQLILG